MSKNRFGYVGTFLGHLDSHGITTKRIGYQWFVIDRSQKIDNNVFSYKIVRHCWTRSEARELANTLNESGAKD